MHEPIVEGLEEYLRTGPGRRPMPEFEAHLAACQECRDLVEAFQQQSVLIQTFRTPKEVEPRSGFYARVMERVDAQRGSSFWNAFLEPAFGFRLAVASATFIMLLGAYWVADPTSELEQPMTAQQSDVVMGPAFPASFSDNPQQDRDAVLVNLSTYSDSFVPTEQ